MTQAPPRPAAQAAPAGWRVALGLFTVFPVSGAAELSRDGVARAVRWLPAAGLAVALPAAGVLAAVEAAGHDGPRRLLAAALAVAALALLTGGLHLDGLADTADGLGSRRPREEALAIMRRPDVGAFGVAGLVFTLLVQITALAAVPPGARAALTLAVAVVTGRVAVLLATGPGCPPARRDGLGALAAGTTGTGLRATAVVALGAGAWAGGLAAGGAGFAARSALAAGTGLLAAGLLRQAAKRRLGGMTGDVYGALVEVSTACALLTVAVAG